MKKRNKLLIITIILFLLVIVSAIVLLLLDNIELTSPFYLANDSKDVIVYDDNLNEYFFPRGTIVDVYDKEKIINEVTYKQFDYEDNTYYVLEEYLVTNIDNCVRETSLYTLRDHVLTSSYDDYHITGWVKKNTEVTINGFNKLLDDGTVDYYYVNNEGYISSRFLSDKFYETSYDPSIYSDCYFGEGGDPTRISYYKKDEVNFENNNMPGVVKALYINAEAIGEADSYIELANASEGINAFVVDIKDCYIDTQLAYESPVSKIYAPSTSNIPNTYETYKENVKKLKDAGYYLIGRITAFKDDAFANDNPSEALEYNGSLYQYGSVKWPSIYSRKMWEYNLALAYEAASDFGFNEIQFDYCRLPEDVEGVDLKNNYNESRIEAVTNFLRYASEYLHNIEVYVSADVFGEISGDDQYSFSCFASYYGQFWPAISNTVDAISSMPYPDHFSYNSYGIFEPWMEPGELMYNWGLATYYAQANTYDKAKCRTWIEAQSPNAYDIIYDVSLVKAQIEGLKNASIFDGYMTWSASSNINRYWSYIEAFE